MNRISDEAVCIRHWDWSETSQTVSLFTRAHGIVRALAKGSRRPKSPYSGGLEVLTAGGATAILRPGSDLALLTEWDLQKTFPHLRRSLRPHRAGLYAVDLVHHLVTDHDPHPLFYDALVTFLDQIADPARITSMLLRFQWLALVETGYRPILGTDDPVEKPARFLRFDPSAGGIIPDGFEPQSSHRAWRVRPQTIALLRHLDSAEWPSVLESAAPQTVDRAARLLAAHIRFLLGREPRTMPVVFGNHLPR